MFTLATAAQMVNALQERNVWIMNVHKHALHRAGTVAQVLKPVQERISVLIRIAREYAVHKHAIHLQPAKIRVTSAVILDHARVQNIVIIVPILGCAVTHANPMKKPVKI